MRTRASKSTARIALLEPCDVNVAVNVTVMVHRLVYLRKRVGQMQVCPSNQSTTESKQRHCGEVPNQGAKPRRRTKAPATLRIEIREGSARPRRGTRTRDPRRQAATPEQVGGAHVGGASVGAAQGGSHLDSPKRKSHQYIYSRFSAQSTD